MKALEIKEKLNVKKLTELKYFIGIVWITEKRKRKWYLDPRQIHSFYMGKFVKKKGEIYHVDNNDLKLIVTSRKKLYRVFWEEVSWVKFDRMIVKNNEIIHVDIYGNY